MPARSPADRMTCLIQDMFHAIDRSEWHRLADYFLDSATYDRPGYQPLEGLARIRDFYERVRIIGSGVHGLEGVVATAHLGACWGTFYGATRDGAPVSVRFADTYVFERGLIAHRRSHFFVPSV